MCLFGFVGGCASHVAEDDEALTPEQSEVEERASSEPGATAHAPAIATMVTKSHRLEVRLVDGDPSFTVATIDGDALAHDVDLWQLARDYPRLHRQYETAFAGEGVTLDASVNLDSGCESCEAFGLR